MGRIVKKAMKEGVLINDGVAMFPDLNVEFELAQKGLNKLEE